MGDQALSIILMVPVDDAFSEQLLPLLVQLETRILASHLIDHPKQIVIPRKFMRKFLTSVRQFAKKFNQLIAMLPKLGTLSDSFVKLV